MAFGTLISQLMMFAVVVGIMTMIMSIFHTNLAKFQEAMHAQQKIFYKRVNTRAVFINTTFAEWGNRSHTSIYLLNTGNTPQKIDCIEVYFNRTYIPITRDNITILNNTHNPYLWDPGETLRIHLNYTIVENTTQEVKVVLCNGVQLVREYRFGEAKAPTTTTTTTLTTTSSTTTTTFLGQGEPCSDNSECASNYCVDGVCCDTACDGICEACNLSGWEGTCTYIPAGQDPDDECNGVDCNPGTTNYYYGWISDTCYYRADEPAATHYCNGAGACESAEDVCPDNPAGDSTGVTRPVCHTLSLIHI